METKMRKRKTWDTTIGTMIIGHRKIIKGYGRRGKSKQVQPESSDLSSNDGISPDTAEMENIDLRIVKSEPEDIDQGAVQSENEDIDQGIVKYEKEGIDQGIVRSFISTDINDSCLHYDSTKSRTEHAMNGNIIQVPKCNASFHTDETKSIPIKNEFDRYATKTSDPYVVNKRAHFDSPLCTDYQSDLPERITDETKEKESCNISAAKISSVENKSNGLSEERLQDTAVKENTNPRTVITEISPISEGFYESSHHTDLSGEDRGMLQSDEKFPFIKSEFSAESINFFQDPSKHQYSDMIEPVNSDEGSNSLTFPTTLSKSGDVQDFALGKKTIKDVIFNETPKSKAKRNELTLQEKAQLICSSDGKSQRTLAEEFKISKTQVCSILKRKAELMEAYENEMNPYRKRQFNNSPYVRIDDIVYEWFSQMHSQGIPVSGAMIQAKALDVAKDLNQLNFKASMGWLTRFKGRHIFGSSKIFGCIKISGEKSTTSQETIDNSNAHLPTISGDQDATIDNTCSAQETLDNDCENNLILEATKTTPENDKDDEKPVPASTLTNGEVQEMLCNLRQHFLSNKIYDEALQHIMAAEKHFQDATFQQAIQQHNLDSFVRH